MKKTSLHLFLFTLISVFTFQACDDDGYSIGNFVIRMATVERQSEGSAPYFVWDNGKAVWAAAGPSASNLRTGQRIWASFTLLSDRSDMFAHDVRLNWYQKVLTKGIIDLTEANQDSIGNDPVHITYIWMNNDYLNVEFEMVRPTSERHMVNLVRNTIEEANESDDYVHLEYRYNNQGDEHGPLVYSMVSFKLDIFNDVTAELKPKGIKVKVNTYDGEKIITLNAPQRYIEENGNISQTANGEEIE